MEPVHLLTLASRQAEWLTARQSVISGNIANANTPGFKAKDIAPFKDALEQAGMRLAATQPGHISINDVTPNPTRVDKANAWEVHYSGNSVSIEQEMLKASSISREYSLNTSIVKAFHRMFLAASKSS